MGVPETRYARSGDVAVAYQVLGEGPFDVIFAPGTVSHVELFWDAAGMAALLRGIAEHARLIIFDKRGTGLSDRDVGVPTLEERSDDIRAVMDAAGSERAALFGGSEGAPMSIVFAAPACTPASARRSTARSPVSQSRSARGCPRWQRRARCWCHKQSKTWWQGQGSPSPTVASRS